MRQKIRIDIESRRIHDIAAALTHKMAYLLW